jgi:hypothetical protein
VIGQDGQAVQVPLGPKLLGQPDGRVEDGQAADGDGAAPLAEQEQRHGGGDDQGVEQGEQVAGEDVPVLGAVRARGAVHVPALHPLGHLGSGQPAGLGLFRKRHYVCHGSVPSSEGSLVSLNA